LTQTAIVKRIINDGLAEVSVERASACGDSCATCAAGCSRKRVLNVTAVNKISALPGDRVIIESSGLKFFSIAALVYILPLAFFLAAYFLATLLNAMESVCILISTGAFIVGCLAVYLINKFIRRDRKLDFEIVSFAP
jgi:sigma-E factor negative regulatory protein RseC